MRILGNIKGISFTQDDEGCVRYLAGATIDADGANGQSGPGTAAYRMDNKGLDYLANACYPDKPHLYKNILVCAGDKPFIQPDGSLISKTTYEWKGKAIHDPARYVDSYSVPYIAVPPQIRKEAKGIVLGCKALVINLQNNKAALCVVADIGPASHIGEVSIAAARLLGIPSSPKNGGEEKLVIKYALWPGTAATINGVTYDLQPLQK